MKIKDVVCAAGSTGFYFDDQRAIKRGAGHDGMFYIGQPVTEGFSAVPVTESLNILLRGLESEMAQITAEDLRITVDLSGITEPGVHTVPVTVQVANYANVGVKGSYQIVVDVERLP